MYRYSERYCMFYRKVIDDYIRDTGEEWSVTIKVVLARLSGEVGL